VRVPNTARPCPTPLKVCPTPCWVVLGYDSLEAMSGTVQGLSEIEPPLDSTPIIAKVDGLVPHVQDVHLTKVPMQGGAGV